MSNTATNPFRYRGQQGSKRFRQVLKPFECHHAILYRKVHRAIEGIIQAEARVTRSEKLERFILGFGLQIRDEGFGRATSLSSLLIDVQKECGDCDQDALLH